MSIFNSQSTNNPRRPAGVGRVLAVAVLSSLMTTGAFALDDKPASPAPVINLPGLQGLVSGTNVAPDKVVVKAKGFEIKQSQFDKALGDLKKEASAGGQEIPAEEISNVLPKLLNHLILTHLLDTRATDADKAAGKAEATNRIEELKKQMHGEETLITMLKAGGMSLEDLQTQFTTEATSHAVLKRIVNISEAQVKSFYESNLTRFQEPEKVRASHVLIGTMNPKTGTELTEAEKKTKRTLAESILKRAKDGEDFAKLVKEFSDDSGSKENGGEYTFGRKEMVAPFENAAFSMTTNQVSDIVTSEFGYHIIKLLEKFPARPRPMSEVREALEDEEIEKQLPKLFTQWRKDSQVEVVDEKLKSLDVKEAQELQKAEKGAPSPAAPAAPAKGATPPPIPPK